MPLSMRRLADLSRKLVVGLAAGSLAVGVAPRAMATETPPQIDHTYGVYADGLRALTITARYAITPDGYAIRSTMRSAGILGWVVRMNLTSQATGHFVPDGVNPVSFDSAGYSRGADRHVVLDYNDGRAHIALETPPEPSREPIPAESLAPAKDTLSALIQMQRTVRAHHSCDGSAIVFDGARLLRVQAWTVGQQDMPDDSRQPYHGSALRCDFTDVQIAGFRQSDGPGSAARKTIQGKVWFQDVPGDGLTIVRVLFDHPKFGRLAIVMQG
ncbi:conserved hypothetical protein [Gluconacetobacter diazotrophicus PA1 5]|nr:conserved hypothetical protein [Gluconacetobacter diazotrophicus PA1 5]TWB10344.1 uncharacterized protein DUF3108 [Gluconacetobacter diazotrophicus]